MRLIRKRRWFQTFSFLAINAYIPSWFKGEIYQGNFKGVCVPVLNCYSCPSALGACPLGAMQNFFATARFNISIAQYQLGLYVIGFLGAVGALVGRMPCGWLCPFGLLSEGIDALRAALLLRAIPLLHRMGVNPETLAKLYRG